MEFPLLGQQVAIDLANTLWVHAGRRHDALETVAVSGRWVAAVADLPLSDGSTLREAAADLGPEVMDEEFRVGLVELRDHVRLLLGTAARGGRPAAKVLEAVNRVAAAAPSQVQAHPVDGGAIRLVRMRPGPVSAAVRAALAEDALATATVKLLAACPSPGCLGIYVQDDPRRHYCSPTCANRARVARHYARNRR